MPVHGDRKMARPTLGHLDKKSRDRWLRCYTTQPGRWRSLYNSATRPSGCHEKTRRLKVVVICRVGRPGLVKLHVRLFVRPCTLQALVLGMEGRGQVEFAWKEARLPLKTTVCISESVTAVTETV